MDIITLASIVALGSVIPLIALIVAVIIKTVRDGSAKDDLRYAMYCSKLYVIRLYVNHIRTN